MGTVLTAEIIIREVRLGFLFICMQSFNARLQCFFWRVTSNTSLGQLNCT